MVAHALRDEAGKVEGRKKGLKNYKSIKGKCEGETISEVCTLGGGHKKSWGAAGGQRHHTRSFKHHLSSHKSQINTFTNSG